MSSQFKLSSKVSVEFQKICDEKIDIVVFDPNNLTKQDEAFLTIIEKKKIIVYLP